MQLETNGNSGGGKHAKGDVEPEDPTPGRVLGEGSPDNWADDTSDGPLQADDSHPFASIPKTNEICHQDVGQAH